MGRQLKIERQEDQSKWSYRLQDELVAHRAAVTEGLETRLAAFRHDLGVNPTKAIRALGNGPSAGASPGRTDVTVSGSHRLAGSGGAPIVLGRRIEWAISMDSLVA